MTSESGIVIVRVVAVVMPSASIATFLVESAEPSTMGCESRNGALKLLPMSLKLTVTFSGLAVPVPRPVRGRELPLKVLLLKKPSSVSRKTCREIE